MNWLQMMGCPQFGASHQWHQSDRNCQDLGHWCFQLLCISADTLTLAMGAISTETCTTNRLG